MFPQTPDKTKLPLNQPENQPGKEEKKATIQVVSRPATALPPPPAQSPRVQVMQTPTHSSPRVNIITPTETKKST